MGILAGAASISRFNIVSRPPEPEFEAVRFEEIPPGSEIRERVGFLPVEPEAPYQAGNSRFAFRLRIDRLRPDPTAVQERVKELIHTELETTGAPYVGAKKRKEFRHLAEEELIVRSVPRSKIIEGCLDGDVLYIASTAKANLGTVLLTLRHIGVVADFKAPWLDRQDPELESEIVETFEPGHSIYGCRFLRALVGDRELMIEPEAGHVRLQTREAKVTLTGQVMRELIRYVEEGAEILAAKLLTPVGIFRLDGLSFRISGLKVETERHDHWTELLDERLEKIAAAHELLERRFAALAPQLDR